MVVNFTENTTGFITPLASKDLITDYNICCYSSNGSAEIDVRWYLGGYQLSIDRTCLGHVCAADSCCLVVCTRGRCGRPC